MSYRVGIGAAWARELGVPARAAHIVCDGCGKTINACGSRGVPFKWFLSGKKAPGWSGKKLKNTAWREDYCPACTKERREP